MKEDSAMNWGRILPETGGNYGLIVAMSLIVQGTVIAEMHIVALFMRLLTESPLTRRLCVSYISSNMPLTTHK